MQLSKILTSYFGNVIVSTNDVILNRSCEDMKVEASYVESLHKTKP